MIKQLLTLFALCCYFCSFAQTPAIRINKVNSENYCIGTELSIDVTVEGVFPADNKFTVVAYRYWDDPARRWEYPAVLRGSKLVTVLKDAALADPQSFQIRVVSSNPKTETDANGWFRALTKSSVRLMSRWGYSADTLNSNEAVVLALVATPMTPGEAILNTGEKIQLNYTTSDGAVSYPTFVTFPRTREGVYSIKEASSVCGALSVIGQVSIKVNAGDLMPADLNPEQPCEGSEIKVIFDPGTAAFNASTKYRVRFASDNVGIGTYKFVDAPATLTAKNELTARVPDNLLKAMDSGGGIYIGIVTENPSIVSVNKALKVSVYPKPSFSLTAEKTAISLGEQPWISGNPKGLPPFKFTFTSGETFAYNTQASPDKTTQYQVKKFESGCGVIENPAQAPLVIAVRPSLLLGERGVSANVKPFCEGQTARMRFRAVGVNAQTTFLVEGTNYTGTKISFPAKIAGDSLEFFIPKRTAEDPARDYGDITSLRVVSANPVLASPYTNVLIQSPPFMTPAPNYQPNVPYPSGIRLDYYVWGSRSYTVELMDGTKETYDYRNIYYNLFVRKDTTFRVKSISNECFVNSNLPAFPIKVLKPSDTTPAMLTTVPGTADRCGGDSIAVSVNFAGNFEAGNRFALSYPYSDQTSTGPYQNLTKQGVYKIALTDRPEDYLASFSLSSTLPRLTSESGYFYVRAKPQKPSIHPQTVKEYPERMYLGDSPRVTVYASRYSTLRYSVDGKEKTIGADHNGMQNVPLELTNGKVSEFKLISVTNPCGTYNSDITGYYTGVAYKLVLERTDFSIYHCVGTEAEIKFGTESGTAGAGTNFTLEISKSGDQNSYTEVATATDSRIFKFKVPDLTAGSYYLRARSSDGIYSEAINFMVGKVPTSGSFDGSSRDVLYAHTLTVDYGSGIVLSTVIDGDQPWGLVYSDGARQEQTANYTSYSLVVTAPQVFTISKIWNSCGYGKIEGSVTVKVKPIIALKKYPENSDAIICAGQTIQLDYQIKGAEFQANNYLVFSFLSEQGNPVKLDSVNNAGGRIQLKIPANIAGGTFAIKAEIAALQASGSIGYQLYASPDMTLFGDNTITGGETTTLYVRANNKFPYGTSFQLSDGKSYTHTAPYPGGIREIKLMPTATTTYTLKELKSTCGIGKVSGSATITVQPRLSRWLSVEGVKGLRNPNVCNSDTMLVFFYLNAGPSVETTYEVQLSDSTGNNFVSLPTSGNFSPVAAVVPASLKRSDFYRVRLVPKDASISPGTVPGGVSIGQYATAKVLTPSVYYKPGQKVEAVIGLEGSSPFYYRFGDANFSQFRNVAKYTDTLRLSPASPLLEYRILQVGNGCGQGKVGDPSAFRIELITANEPLPSGEVITFGPNPTAAVLSVQFQDSAQRELEIFNAAGKSVYTGWSHATNTAIDVSALPAGTYLVQVRKKAIVTTYRIIKY